MWPSMTIALLAAAQSTTAAPAPAPPATYARVDERTPREGTPLIAEKLYPMAGRFELDAGYATNLAAKYVHHDGVVGGLTFHAFYWLGVEAYGGYLWGGEESILKDVRNDGTSARRARANESCAQQTCEPQLTDMWMTTWFAGGDVQWAPIYGKLSAASELDLTFQVYGRVGGGVEGIERQLNTGAREAGPLRPSANAGVGLRVIPWKYLALRVELVDSWGLNPDVKLHVGGGSVADVSDDLMVHLGLGGVL